MKKLKLLKGTRFTSFLFILTSALVAAGILWGANTYYNIDTGEIVVENIQRIANVIRATTGIIVGGTASQSPASGVTFEVASGNVLFSTGGTITQTGTGTTTLAGPVQLGNNVTFTGTTARTITGPSTGGLTVKVANGPLTLSTTGSGTLAVTSAGALNLTGSAASTWSVGTGNTLTLTSQNFRVDSAGNITVAAGQGLDTIAAGVLNLGNTTATTVNIGNTAATTISLGAGGALARTINIGTGTGVDTINIGTGGTGADVITIGGGAGTLAINTGDWDISTTGDITGIGGITADQWSIAGASGNIVTAGDLAVNGGDITTTAGTFNLLNSGATTINFAGAATLLNIGSSAGLTVDAPGALTVQFQDGVGTGFILQGSTPFNYLVIDANGKVTLASRGTQDLVLDAGSGAVRIASGDTLYVDGIAVGGEGTLIGIVPIFGFDLPVQTATTSYVQVSRVLENYPFPTAATGTTRVHKLVFRYAASTTAAIDVKVLNVDTNASTTLTLAVPGSNDLERGNAQIVTASIPTANRWRVDVKTATDPDVVRIYAIFLAGFDVK